MKLNPLEKVWQVNHLDREGWRTLARNEKMPSGFSEHIWPCARRIPRWRAWLTETPDVGDRRDCGRPAHNLPRWRTWL